MSTPCILTESFPFPKICSFITKLRTDDNPEQCSTIEVFWERDGVSRLCWLPFNMKECLIHDKFNK